MINSKKAFTLIELLAVIIILAIVALIATPIVLDVVDDARTSAAKSETAMIVSGINNYCATAEMKAQMNNTTSICADGVTKEEVALMVDLGNAKVLEIEYGNISTGEVAMVASLENARVADETKKSGVTYLKVESNTKIVIYNGRTYKIDGEVVETPDTEEPNEPEKVLYKDNSGANEPELLDNMIPVKYDGTSWVYADLYEEWYDYDAKEWANAVVLNSGVTKSVGDTINEEDIALMYVWIPRYTYTIFNGNNEGVPEQVINVKFESGTTTSGTVTCVDAINQTDASGNKISEICTDATNGSVTNGKSTYTHPAFTFGTESLKGFWVGKFEVSGSASQITIKPNVDSLRSQTVSAFFTAIQNIDTVYGTNGNSHMMKNMEWGAVAYLKQSKYGLGTTNIGINNYYDKNNKVYKTGCGAAAGSNSSTTCNAYNDGGEIASTTGNVYGVYDMSGGTYEFVMGHLANSSGFFYSGSAGFTTDPDAKYYDFYTYDSSSYTTHGRGKLGDATKETLATFGNASGGWNSDYAYFPESTASWFGRGGNYKDLGGAGVFYFGRPTGGANSTYSARAVLVK